MIKSEKEFNGVSIDAYGNEKVGLMYNPPRNYKKKVYTFISIFTKTFFFLTKTVMS